MKPRPVTKKVRRHPDGHDQVEALGRCPQFAGCSRAQLRRIEALTCAVAVPTGRVLVREGERPQQVLFVTAGHGRATWRSAPVGTYETGSCIGAREVVAREASPVTVTAEAGLTVLAASGREFRSLTDIPAVARIASAPALVTDAAGVEPDEIAAHAWPRPSRPAYALAGDDDWAQLAAAVPGAGPFRVVAPAEGGKFES